MIYENFWPPSGKRARPNIAWASVIRAASTAKKLFNISVIRVLAELSILHHHYHNQVYTKKGLLTLC